MKNSCFLFPLFRKPSFKTSCLQSRVKKQINKQQEKSVGKNKNVTKARKKIQKTK